MKKIRKVPRHSNSLASKQKKFGVIFTLPSIIGLVVVFIPTIIMSFTISISDIKFDGMTGYTFIPVQFKYYYNAFFIDPTFRRVLLSSVTVLWVQVLIIVIFSLFISVILNQKFKGRVLARAILFLPVILATGLISKVDSMDTLMSGMAGVKNVVDTGSLNQFNFMQLEHILKNINFMPQMVDTVIAAVNGLYDIVLNSGVQILIFLAGLQSIPSSLYEAAYVDGITGWQSFWKITIPMISPLILVNVIYTVIASFIDPKNGAMNFIQTVLSTGNQYSYAAALSWIYFSIVIIIIAFIMLLSKKLVFYNK